MQSRWCPATIDCMVETTLLSVTELDVDNDIDYLLSGLRVICREGWPLPKSTCSVKRVKHMVFWSPLRRQFLGQNQDCFENHVLEVRKQTE